MNIFLHELKTYRKTTLIWIIGLGIITITFLSIYSTFTKDVATTKKILETLPYSVRQGLGISFSNFFTIYGLYAYIFLYISLAGSIQAMNLGVSILSKEITLHTADFLMVKPVSRFRILTEKLAAAGVLIVLTNISFILLAYVGVRLNNKSPLNLHVFILISLMLFFIQIIFFALGVCVATLLPKVKSVIAVSLPIVFSLFIISTIGAIIGNHAVRYISPFKYFDTNYIITHHSYEYQYLGLEAVITLVLIGIAYRVYIFKDIRSAS